MYRPRALIVCSRPDAYEPTRVHEAATYLLQMSGATEDERRLASDAIKRLRGKRDERLSPTDGQKADRPAVKPKRKGRA